MKFILLASVIVLRTKSPWKMSRLLVSDVFNSLKATWNIEQRSDEAEADSYHDFTGPLLDSQKTVESFSGQRLNDSLDEIREEEE